MINIRYIKRIIKKYLCDIGYICTGQNIFYKVCNDIIQRIEFDYVVSIWCYRIYFDLIPFSAGKNIKEVCSDGVAYDLSILTKEVGEDYPLNHSETLVANEIVSKIANFILPFFDKCKDSISAYCALCEVQKEYKHTFNNIDSKFYDLGMYWLALDAGDYLTAKRVIEEFIEQNTDAFESNMQYFKSDSKFKQRLLERHEKQMNKWKGLLEILKPENKKQLLELVEKNKATTRQSFKL